MPSIREKECYFSSNSNGCSKSLLMHII